MSYLQLARQPIFNQKFELQGYELLYRDGDVDYAKFDSDVLATSRVLLASLVDIGFDKLMGGHDCHINISSDYIDDINSLTLEDEAITLELKAPLALSPTQLNTLHGLSKRGYKLAINNYQPNTEADTYLGVFDYIKCNSLELSLDQLEQSIRIAKDNNCQSIATHIENYHQVPELIALGYDLFQGFFLSKPDLTREISVPTTLLTVIQTLSRILDPNLELDELEGLISSDVSLSYRVLRLLNSAQYNVKDIDSINRAIVYLGRDAIKNLTIIIILSGIDDKPSELTKLALVRAKMCEILACQVDMPDPNSYFAVGLLSTLTALLDKSMSEIISMLPLNEELENALMLGPGVKGQTLQCVLEYEECRSIEFDLPNLEASELTEYYMQAVEWAEETFNGLSL